MTTGELENKMACLLGGRAAERLVFGELSTGAADDLEKVTEIARSMVMRYGMDETLGEAVYAPTQPLFIGGAALRRVDGTTPYSEKTASQIDQAVRDLLAQAQSKAAGILKQNRELLDQTAEMLLAKETLSADELPKRVSFMTVPRRLSQPVGAEQEQSSHGDLL